MISARILSAFAATALFSMATAESSSSSSSIRLIPTPTVTLPANAMTDQGCYETGLPLENHGPYEFQSPGNCQFICIEQKKPVMALTDGENCWCGDLIPAKEWKTDNSSCDTPCRGTKEVFCGGPSMFQVFLTGTTMNRIEHYEPPVSSSSSSSSATPTPTKAPVEKTATPTPTETPEEEKKKSSGPNKAGIAAGVVVGVVALCAIVGGVIFFLRQRKRRELEEEHRRRNIHSFVAGGKLHTSNSSMTDSRLDPEFMNRRQSNGSIADNEDYSRRILKVTNA